MRFCGICFGLLFAASAVRADGTIELTPVQPPRVVQERPYVSQPLDRVMNARQTAVINTLSSGRRVGRPLQQGGFENQVMVAYAITDWLTVETFGAIASVPAGRSHSFGSNARFLVLDQRRNQGLNLVLTGSALREHDGAPVLQASYAAGRDFGRANVTTSGIFEKAFARNRDAVDAILSFGLSYAVLRDARLGIEAVSEDLEAFWETEEAEGGARLVVGPTLVVELADQRLNLGLHAGAGVAYLPRPTPSGEPQRVSAMGGRLRLAYTF